jgi:hypothetical protein
MGLSFQHVPQDLGRYESGPYSEFKKEAPHHAREGIIKDNVAREVTEPRTRGDETIARRLVDSRSDPGSLCSICGGRGQPGGLLRRRQDLTLAALEGWGYLAERQRRSRRPASHDSDVSAQRP